MPNAWTLVGLLVLGVVVTTGFAFTLIGLVGEAIAVLALLGLVGRGVHYLIRASRPPNTDRVEPDYQGSPRSPVRAILSPEDLVRRNVLDPAKSPFWTLDISY